MNRMVRILAAAMVALVAAESIAAKPGVDVKAEAAKIDALVAADLKRNNIEPNGPIDDATFLRRAYLDIAGRIPSYAETNAFLDSTDPAKRSKLIDALLGSEAYVSNAYNMWADILRIKSRLTNQVAGGPYIDWVKQSLRENKPYDTFVYELLTAEGRIDDNGAAGYYLRDSGMPLDNTSNTVRIFLGTQIGCAQCHDHPFDKWTQFEFYEMSAYTFGVQTRKRPENVRNLRQEAQKAGLSSRQQQVVQRIVQISTNQVYENKYQTLKLPDDYKYDDAKPKQTVEPMTIMGAPAKVAKGQSPREVFAKWLTSPDNPRFAMTIANRLWAKAMGVGIIDPVDDIRDDHKASNPELLAHLTELMKRVDFDMRAYLRVVYNTRTYQSAVSRYELEPGVAYHFPGPVLRRMRAEQIWDSVITLAIPDPDERPGNAADRRGFELLATLNNGDKPLDISKMSTQELIALVKKIPDNPRDRETATKAMFRERMKDRFNDPAEAKWRGFPRDMVRASELEQPAKPGHFLQEFGQSDREIIENSSTDPSVTQVLTMLNGPIEKSIIANPNSMLVKTVTAAGADPAARIRVIFRSVFNRDPYPAELANALAVVKNAGEKTGYNDLVWAMFNTREFIFVQ